LRYNARQRVVVLEVANVAAFSEFVPSLGPSNHIGLGTRLLTTPADYGDRCGSARRFLENMEQYCREMADLTVDLRPGIKRLNDPADERDLLQFNIRIAKEQLRRGTYPADVLKDIASSHQHLSLALGRYTSSGVKHRKNHKAPRQSDRLVMTRDEWIRKRVGALLDQGMELTRASKSVEQELSKLLEFHRVTVGHRQIRNICQRAGIGVGSRRSSRKKD
jgi:hypothetical protein